MSKRLAVALLLLAPVLSAQGLFFGEAVPQTHTRYGAAGAEPRLVTNGRDFFLFWAADSKLRVTRLVDGQNRAGRPVLSGEQLGAFDVVWTGTHFLVVADDVHVDGYRQIRGRMVNVDGEPTRVPFTIVARGEEPSVAFDGARVVLTYEAEERLASILLRPDGVPATDPHEQAVASPRPLHGAVAHGGPGFVAAAAYPTSVQITTMGSSSEVAGVSQFSVPPLTERRIAVASSGSEVLAAWTNGSGPAGFLTVRADGTATVPATIAGTDGATAIDVVWDGTRWLVGTIIGGKLNTRLLDGAEAGAQAKAHAASPVSLAAVSGRTLAAWRGTGSGQPVVVRDLARTGDGVDAAFAAAEQRLHAAASSHDAALAVWSEVRDGKRTLHAGVRGVTGTWRENRIGSEEDAPLASSDGRLFLVVKQDDDGWSAVTLDETAKVVASTPIVKTFTPTDVAWDGTSWVLIGVAANARIYAVRVMAWGAVSSPVLIHERSGTRTIENPRIAAGGGGFLAVWQDSDFRICFPVCDPYESELQGTRLTATLQRIDTLPLELAEDEAVSPDLFWDGSRFQIFWLDEGGLETRSLRPDAGGSGTTRIAGGQIDTGRLHALETSSGAAITAGDGEVLFLRGTELVERYAVGVPDSPDALVNLGADVAYFQAQVRDEMPYHGASHVFLTLGGVVPRGAVPQHPEITRAAMTNNGRLITLEWTPPPGDVNGYRIEYRIDDGTWNELSEWIDAGATSVTIAPWLERVRYQFRMRAWSDAGVSEYSIPATVRLLGRRRAVR